MHRRKELHGRNGGRNQDGHHQKENNVKMSAILDYRKDFLCVLIDDGIQEKCWFPVTKAQKAEVQTLLGRSITQLDPEKGTYVDEEGNVYQLADKGETKPIAVEHLPGREKTELEALLEASLKAGKSPNQMRDSKRVHRRIRNNGRKAAACAARGERAPEWPKHRAPRRATPQSMAGLPKVRCRSISGRSSPKSAAASATSKSADTTNASTTAT